jgi:hypothetical protein
MAIDFIQTLPTLQYGQDKVALRRVLEGVTAESCPMFYNFHMHTIHSDGQLHPEQLMEQAIAIGLKGLAITDHHSVKGSEIAQHWLQDWRRERGAQNHLAPLPTLWTGAEINADLLGTEVHILAYAFDPTAPDMQIYLQGETVAGAAYQARQVITAIQQAGGLAVLAHPARYRLSATALIPAVAALGIDGVETFYAYGNPTPWQPSEKQTAEVKQLAATFNLLNTCGTDTHGLNLLQRV